MVGREQVPDPHRQLLAVGRWHALAARQAAGVLQQHLQARGRQRGREQLLQ